MFSLFHIDDEILKCSIDSIHRLLVGTASFGFTPFENYSDGASNLNQFFFNKEIPLYYFEIYLVRYYIRLLITF